MKLNFIKFPGLLFNLIKFSGYILLIGPPKALEIQIQANKTEGELSGRSLLVVLLSETALRASAFLLVGFSIEQLLGNESYEKYRIDYLFFWLIVAGAMHIVGYYLDKGIFTNTNQRLGILLYRIGRNFAYAIIPTIFAVLCALYYQFSQQLELFSGILVHIVFFVTYLIFILLGIQEAILSSLSPVLAKKTDQSSE